MKKDKPLSLLTKPHRKYKKVPPVIKSQPIDNWFIQNCTPDFRSKHLSLKTRSAINLATRMRGGKVIKSTVIVLDSYFAKNAFKSIELNPRKSYTLNVCNMVNSTILNWKRGSGSVILSTNEKSQIYHLEAAHIKSLKESNKVTQGVKIKF